MFGKLPDKNQRELFRVRLEYTIMVLFNLIRISRLQVTL